jgi:hypothetical protein
MRTLRRRLPSLATALLLVLNTSLAPADNATYDYSRYPGEEPSFFEMGADLVVRPMTLAVTAVGAAIWLVALPITLLGGNTEQAADVLVLTPGRYTFYRPLGDMELNAPTGWEKSAERDSDAEHDAESETHSYP